MIQQAKLFIYKHTQVISVAHESFFFFLECIISLYLWACNRNTFLLLINTQSFSPFLSYLSFVRRCDHFDSHQALILIVLNTFFQPAILFDPDLSAWEYSVVLFSISKKDLLRYMPNN